MEKFTMLTDAEMEIISGGKYYGNGVSCDDNGCTVDWGKAWNCGVNRWAAAAATGGKGGDIGNC
ncbi:leucocin A/sakacin P family class II bacteriocin [Clostridium saccharobutylicum]|uniref:Class II bacteriocin n=1 Tax=Clostridium saccharobutylicum DSM 13864 TaxID=1345695 RepID=U5MYK9_CLOSA|nr:leucocin A/sakacin P family class II bacteriocin [Clostridium saccharobutylicum]AGX44736.1 class II bacteriocin [Clostridium saccharobutylicum DSM 13864]AQR92023.1 bacteriocin pediocin PA-1 precursor [Clostridium saccharobutylicum]AQS01925.1 bacteriocin pediocin PA-1 precursor [Clostridium saccharobutylicum]AQS11525.1 bacteriocin pediocin PA-1 precursor [Clostridium saccharobutylicum]AQS15908.1 bacteriocin pediocin PA-1 precursor [Clostridium saccharobutylicum]